MPDSPVEEEPGEPVRVVGGSKITVDEGSKICATIKGWSQDQRTDLADTLWNAAVTAAMLGIAIANAEAQRQIAEKQQDLADSYYHMERDKWDRFKGQYQPLETKLLDNVASEPVKELDCAGAKQRAASAVSSAYDVLEQAVPASMKKYRITSNAAHMRLLLLRQTNMRVDTENYNLFDERWFMDYKNDQRWNRRSNVLNLGRNLSNDVLKYGDVANSMLKDVSARIEKAAGYAMGALGYYGSRNSFEMPVTNLSNFYGLISGVGAPSTGAMPLR